MERGGASERPSVRGVVRLGIRGRLLRVALSEQGLFLRDGHGWLVVSEEERRGEEEKATG